MELAGRVVLALTLLMASNALAQTTPSSTPPSAEELPTYDISTVRPNTSLSGNQSVNTRHATFQAENWGDSAIAKNSNPASRGSSRAHYLR
ncbi:MAG: hypothetical protein ACRYFU_22165 [Janthinobacterium lividum]